MPLEDEEQELSLLDIFMTLWRWKIMILFITFVFGAVALIYAFTRDFTYRGECRIMPPSSSSGGVSGFAAQFGSFADLVGLPRNATTGQMLIGILEGDSVIDAIIDRFNLMEEYSQDIRLSVRSAVRGHLDAAQDAKSGIISVAYIDTDPQKAADIANACVQELQRKIQDISVRDAQQRRNFYEHQLNQAIVELNEAEDAMIAYQQASGVIAFESQSQALLASIASLRNQIAAKNVQISSLSSYARQDNPNLKRAISELEAMTKELNRLEEEQKRTTDSARTGRSANGDTTLSSVGQIPELGIEYQRYVRQLQFATAKYELMLRQYENARIGEANDLSTISVIDYATPPDYKYGPRRARITIIGTGAGMCLSVFLAFLIEHLKSVSATRAKYKYEDEDDYDE